MLRCKSEKFRSSAKLVDGLKVNTKEDLKNIAQLLCLSIPSKLRKEEYAAYMAEAVLNCPTSWLPQLTRYELILLQNLVKAGPDTYIEAPNILMTTALETLSLVITDYDYVSEGKIRYMICDELREAVASHVDEYLMSKEQEIHFTIEQYVLGIVNLYGFLPYTEMLRLLDDYLQDSVTKKEIAHTLSESILIRHHMFEMVGAYNTIHYIRSPFLWDIEDLDQKLYARRDITKLKTFTGEEVFKAGMFPFIDVSNPCSDDLRQYMMKKLGYTEDTIAPDLQNLWLMSQVEENSMSIITSLINGKLNSMQELQEAIEIFTGYLNHSPRWFLKGYSPDEAFVLFEKDKLMKTPPRIVAGPNMKAAGMDVTPDMQTALDNLFRDTFSDQRVGRNDPCPCGSGKKYKKCCGRDN